MLAHLRAEKIPIQAGPVSRIDWTDAIRLFPRPGNFVEVAEYVSKREPHANE